MDKITETLNQYHIQIFPNPNTGKFSIKGDKLSEIAIYTIEGHLVKSIEAHHQNLEMDLSGEAKGVYFIQFSFEDEVISQKLILQ
ncbi:MAG: hypothetical protein DSY77_09085 [Bacteroidetes bacterium]|nr:MAG: hypothetical protein DSY77_09085 [Bacteroidota bacterium]